MIDNSALPWSTYTWFLYVLVIDGEYSSYKLYERTFDAPYDGYWWPVVQRQVAQDGRVLEGVLVGAYAHRPPTVRQELEVAAWRRARRL